MAAVEKVISPQKSKELHLPISRVKTIMKSSPDVDVVGQEPLFLVTKVTELFVVDLAKQAFKECKSKSLDYKHIANVVQCDDTLDFLREIMPMKITVREFREMMAEKKKRGDEDSTSEESESEEEEEEQSEEESEEEKSDSK